LAPFWINRSNKKEDQHMSNILSGKVALVTGGSRGIGAAIVRRLAGEGAAVAFTYAASKDKAQAVAQEVTAAGGTALALHADSADVAALQQAVAATAEAFGRIDILVNNAGILIPGTVDAYDIADFDRMVAVNVRAVFVATQAAVRHMGQGGRVVNIGSVAADRTGFAGSSVYGMTKGAVASLTRGLARDLGPRGITVNAVQPGPTETDMAAEEHREWLRPMMALGRMGQDSEIAEMVAFLAGPGSSYVTGAALTVDGGYLA
jgi:3-oxoacyl-[acyl-carrier protein] reductase